MARGRAVELKKIGNISPPQLLIPATSTIMGLLGSSFAHSDILLNFIESFLLDIFSKAMLQCISPTEAVSYLPLSTRSNYATGIYTLSTHPSQPHCIRLRR